MQQSAWDEFAQLRFGDTQGEASVTTVNRMADLVRFEGVKKEQLIRFGHRLIAVEMAHEDAAIGKYELRRGRTLLGALRAAATDARSVPDGDDRGFEEGLDVEFEHATKQV